MVFIGNCICLMVYHKAYLGRLIILNTIYNLVVVYLLYLSYHANSNNAIHGFLANLSGIYMIFILNVFTAIALLVRKIFSNKID